jgi:hypothetical protein
MIETETEVPAMYRATEIFNRMRQNGTFIGADIMGYPDVSILQPGELTTITLQFPQDYFPPIEPPLNREETSLLISNLLMSSQYADRSKIAQAGGVSGLAIHEKRPADSTRKFEGITRSTDAGFEAEITFQNLNPVRALQLPPAGFEYIRFFIPGKSESDETVYSIAQTLAIDSADQKYIRVEGGKSKDTAVTRPASIEIDIRNLARYKQISEPISVVSLDAKNRKILDGQIGIDWDVPQEDLVNTTNNANMIIGETCGVNIPEGYVGVVILGRESGYEHQHSTILDAGFSGPIRTEHRILPGSPLPKSIHIFLYKV